MDTSTSLLPPPTNRQMITFVMTCQYNGFAYAGFQRQTRTPTPTLSNEEIMLPGKKRKRNQTDDRVPATKNINKSVKKPSAVVTIQDKIEHALQKWTGLSLSTLRVRGAGRTDKGVSATNQIVAFDVPLSSMVDNEGGGGVDDEKISAHALPLLKEAHETLVSYKSSTKESRPIIDQWKIKRAISTRLPSDIVIRTIRIWNGSTPFEARQHVACKTYTYRLRFRCIAFEINNATSNEAQQPNMHPICSAGPHLLRRLNDNNNIWLSPWPLDGDKLRQACEPFVGRHDFCNFVHKAERKSGNTRPSLIRRRERYQDSTSENANDDNNKFVMDLFEFNLDLTAEEELDKTLPPIFDATFSLKAKGFHRSQVRNLVGFVVDVARGERMLDDAKVLLGEKDGVNDEKTMPSVNSAPACGLCLSNVEYEHDEFV